MKTFKQHIKEEGEGIGTHDQNSVEDGSIGVHNVHDPDVLERVNIFVKSISMKEYLSPEHAIYELRNKLMRVGLNFDSVDLKGDNGKQTVQVSRFKTFGKSDDGQDIEHDGISDVKEGGLKLEIEHTRISSGTSKVYCKLI
tara:strand:+ start:4014 stop:4436 length:423 start_codon:yes stop_codon:yes gene_type:complete